MLLATKVKAVSDEVRVEVAGLILDSGKCTIRDVICVCAPGGTIKRVEFGGTAADPGFFGEDQAKHLRTLCENSCKRARRMR